MADYLDAITRAVFDTATLTGTYQPLNGSGFSSDIKVLKIYNGGTLGIDISFDGVTDQDFYPAGATEILDIQTNHENASSNASGQWRGRKGQIIYGKGTAGVGNLYIVGYT